MTMTMDLPPIPKTQSWDDFMRFVLPTIINPPPDDQNLRGLFQQEIPEEDVAEDFVDGDNSRFKGDDVKGFSIPPSQSMDDFLQAINSSSSLSDQSKCNSSPLSSESESREEQQQQKDDLHDHVGVITADKTLMSDGSPMQTGQVGKKRKRANYWTEDEHRKFIIGLIVLGSGQWAKIAKEYVKTRDTAQVASHAQKYFRHLQKGAKGQNTRGSIFDITTDSIMAEQPWLLPQTAGPINQQVPLNSSCTSVEGTPSNNNTANPTVGGLINQGALNGTWSMQAAGGHYMVQPPLNQGQHVNVPAHMANGTFGFTNSNFSNSSVCATPPGPPPLMTPSPYYTNRMLESSNSVVVREFQNSSCSLTELPFYPQAAASSTSFFNLGELPNSGIIYNGSQ